MESLEEIFKCNGGSGPVRGWGGCNYREDYNYRNTYFQQAFREMSKAGLIDSPNACREVIECANKFFGSQQIGGFEYYSAWSSRWPRNADGQLMGDCYFKTRRGYDGCETDGLFQGTFL